MKMEWFVNRGAVKLPPEESCCTSDNRERVHEVSAESMASLCERQQRCVKASIVSSWQLVEAQDQLCGLELHGSESVEQARAQALASSAHLSQSEEEWRMKESMLDSRWSPVLGQEPGYSGFDKSIINNPTPRGMDTDYDKSLTFVQRHEEELKHFGMLRRWDDSQRFLAQMPQLICEETANYLILWCFRLYAEEKEALMEQVAHQAVAMQFILEMARSVQQDPRACFRQFFQKAKAGQEGYLNVFHTELEAFKHRVKEYGVKHKVDTPKATEQPSSLVSCRLDPKEVLESLPPVAEYHIKRCLEAGLCSQPGRGFKDEDTETEDQRMMMS
ncbi:hsp90 co-chaperone Cdc37-like 1 isoform X2 [Hemibagrus wyckioides]|uniref:hsp90 co-chaperone Cdc37-like 1 isoform X2 n=1 Tax=Hemibagrus wyckioides TaxID=337641 RepID=UPI00266CFA8F|nr:hsp90 co-chaperone Cdc37-like 1 isoform X2 [Hemibagrus wyckioides]